MRESSRAGSPPASSSLTGRALAAKQLAALEEASGGLIEVLEESTGSGVPFVVSVETDGIQRGPGIKVRARERFRIYVTDHFPFSYPSVFSDHRRWAGTAHVQWGSSLCLYAAGSVEWNASDGMRGFFDRLVIWLENAAAGTLDPDDRPLHPPATSTSATAGRLIVHPDLADTTPWHDNTAAAPVTGATSTEPIGEQTKELTGKQNDGRAANGLVYAWCTRDSDRYEVLEWLTLDDVVDRVGADEFAATDGRGRRLFVMPLLMIDTDLGWEYPTTAKALVRNLELAGYERRDLLDQIVWGVRINRLIRMAEDVDNDEEVAGSETDGRPGHDADILDVGFVGSDPVLFGLATPSRRVDGVRLPHIVAWKIDAIGRAAADLTRQLKGVANPSAELTTQINDLAQGWIDGARISWVQVHEMRPEVTRRRDDGSSGAWLRGRRVLLLGAGAIGSVVAEHAVRADVQRLVAVDNGVVAPGILVRQPFYDDDIGEYKVDALADRLNRIGRLPVVTPVVGNCHGLFLTGSVGGPDGFVFDPQEFDLIIDATADAGTRAVIERVRAATPAAWPPIVTTLLGHRATRGLAVVAGTGASSSSHELLRRFVVRGLGRAAWADLIDDFFPDPPRTEMFFPEPGCSEPTFVGSASDVMALASTMLAHALDAVAQLSGSQAGPETGSAACSRMRVAGFRLPSAALDESHRNGVEEMSWQDDLVARDAASGVQVRITSEALAEMRAEVRRGARARGPEIETGGMLLGLFDEATGVATVDLASGPAPDSQLSATYFLNGVEGTQDTLDAISRASRGFTRFLGLWHSHPYGPARPSPTDRAGITAITSFTPGARRALMVILGGPEVWDDWVHDGTASPHLYVRVLEATSGPDGGRGGVSHLGSADGSDEGLGTGRQGSALTPYQRMLQTPPPGAYFAGGYSAATVAGDDTAAAELSGLRRVLRAIRLPGAR